MNATRSRADTLRARQLSGAEEGLAFHEAESNETLPLSNSDASRSRVQQSGSIVRILERANEIALVPTHGRPSLESGYTPKREVKVRLDPEVIDWLKSLGPRHYSRINGILRAIMEVEAARSGTEDLH